MNQMQIHVDLIGINMGDFAARLVIGPADQSMQVVAYMHPAVLKQICMLGRRLLKQYEADHDVLKIPARIYEVMGIVPEDW